MTKPTVNTKRKDSIWHPPEHLYKNMDVTFFESIISGPLRPFLSLYHSSKELEKLATIKVEGEFDSSEMHQWKQKGAVPKEILEKFHTLEWENTTFKVSDNNVLYITFSRPEDLSDPVFDFDLPEPPDEKAKSFLYRIKIESDLMKHKAHQVLKQSVSLNHLSLYANKNIQSLKDIAVRAEKLNKKLNPGNRNFLSDSNLYILHILKEYIIRAIMFYQELFQPFLNHDPEEYNFLKRALYGKKYPSLLSENEENQIKETVIEKNDQIIKQQHVIKTLSNKETKHYSAAPNAYTLKSFNSKAYLLTYVMESLKTNGFICEHTDIKDFKRIFNNEVPLKEIKWLTHISDLAHFVRLLHNSYQVIENIEKHKWKVTDKIFVDEWGQPFGWEKFSGKKIPARCRLIENAVEFLK